MAARGPKLTQEISPDARNGKGKKKRQAVPARHTFSAFSGGSGGSDGDDEDDSGWEEGEYVEVTLNPEDEPAAGSTGADIDSDDEDDRDEREGPKGDSEKKRIFGELGEERFATGKQICKAFKDYALGQGFKLVGSKKKGGSFRQLVCSSQGCTYSLNFKESSAAAAGEM